MAAPKPSSGERLALLFSMLAGVAAAAVLSPMDSFFAGNFAFYWVPQLAVLAALLFFSPRPAVLAGVAVTMAIYLILFGAWVFSRPQPESMAWLGYLFSLPGAGVGAIVGSIFINRGHHIRATAVAAISVIFTFVGLSLNQIIICSTVMYCGW